MLGVDGWLLYLDLVQRGGAWASCGPAQSPPRYIVIVMFLEPALMGLCPSGFQPPMANKYCCCCEQCSRFTSINITAIL